MTYKFYGQFDPQVDRFIFEHYFPDVNIRGVFVECGACDGHIESSCKFFEETMGWTGFNIEPATANFEVLQKNRPFSRNLRIGLSSQTGTATFKHAISPIHGKQFGNGSIQHTEEHLNHLKESGCSFEDSEIQVLSWIDFVAREKITHIDLLVLDVEGHEFSVIDGMSGCSVLPDIICVEIGHLGLAEMRRRLDELGYVYDVSSHVNAFFVKREKVALFALRRAGRAQQDSGEAFKRADAQEVFRLRREIETIENSRAWRLIGFFRRVKANMLFWRS